MSSTKSKTQPRLGKRPSRAKKRKAGRSKGAGNRRSALDRLSPAEARAVLTRLLAAKPALRAKIEEIARGLLSEVKFETVADEVEEAVKGLSIEDLHGRSGRHAWGYVEPSEAAWEVLQETVQPFLDNMKRQIDLGLHAEALETCKGVVLGLYRVEHTKDAELTEWAPDFATETAAAAVVTWRRGGPGRNRVAKAIRRRKRPLFPQDFVTQFAAEWGPMIARVQSESRWR